MLCFLCLYAVSNYSHVLEGQSDSDDEDKLHIVEEEGSLLDGADCDSVAPDDDHNGTADQDGRWDDGKPRPIVMPLFCNIETLWIWIGHCNANNPNSHSIAMMDCLGLSCNL